MEPEWIEQEIASLERQAQEFLGNFHAAKGAVAAYKLVLERLREVKKPVAVEGGEALREEVVV